MLNQLSTGLLIDLAPSPELVKSFNGDHNTATSNQSDFYEVLKQIQLMSDGNDDLADMERTDSIIRSYENIGLTPLCFVDYAYEEIPQSAWNLPFLEADSTNRIISFTSMNNPFVSTDSVILLYAPIDPFNLTKSFILPSSLYFTNNDRMVNFEIDFGDGRGFRPLATDRVVLVDYPDMEDDFKHFEIVVRCSERGSSNYHGPIAKTQYLLQKKAPSDLELELSELPQRTCNTSYIAEGDARIHVRYGIQNKDNEEIRHPVIFIEGFDLDRDPFDNRFGDVNWNTLMTGLSFDENGDSTRTNLNDIKFFTERLHQKNFDLIFIDFKDATRSMFDNGQTVIRVLQWVQQNKVGDDGISVFGASLGGLIARYAIRQMEIEGCDHCVKLNCSFDSPHQGAMVPMGVQYAVEFLKSESAEALEGYNSLRRVAAQQALIYNIIPGSNAHRNTWQDWLNDNGHPKYCKNVAMTNGSPIGMNGAFSPEDRYYSFRHRAGGILMTSLDLRAIPDCRNQTFCNKKVFDGYLPVGGTDFSKYMNTFFGIKYNHVSKYFGDDLPYDNSSGGLSGWVGELNDLVTEFFQKLGGTSQFDGSNKRQTTFIPSYSALDLRQKLSHPDLGTLFPDKLESDDHPFDEIYYHSKGNNHNQRHVEFHVEPNQDIDWMMEQLDKVRITHPSTIEAYSGALVYNLKGAQHHTFISNVTIEPQAVLQLNSRNQAEYSYTNCADNSPITHAQFRTINCGTNISVGENARLELGDTKCQDGHTEATLIMGNESILELKNGATLVVQDGSKLNFTKYSKLIIHPNAQIVLNGPDALLDLRGKLYLKQGAKLEIKSQNNSGIGDINFVVNFDHSIIAEGNNSIALVGHSSSNKSKLSISESTLKIPNTLEDFDIENFRILLNNSGSIELASKASFVHTEVQGLSGIENGIAVSKTSDVKFKNVQFKTLNTALTLDESVESPNIENCLFRECNVALNAENEIDLRHNSFQSNNIALLLGNAQNSAIISNSFKGNAIGVEVESDESTEMECSENRFENNDLGLYVKSGRARLSCNTFEDNDLGIYVDESVKLVIGEDPETNILNSGNNIFERNLTGIECNNAHLFIKDGGNSFIQSPSLSVFRFIVGSINAGSSSLNSNFEIDGRGNYWEPVPNQTDLKNATGYYSLNANTTPHRTSIKLSGSFLSSPSQICGEDEHSDQNNDRNKATELTPTFSLVLYPNPSSGDLRLKIENFNDGSLELKVFDLSGREVDRGDINFVDGEAIYQFSHVLANGNYFISLLGLESEVREIVTIER